MSPDPKRVVRRGVGKGYIARECLAPASKACKGKTGREFQECRKAYIRECLRRLGYEVR
jgi:hypothetical protein